MKFVEKTFYIFIKERSHSSVKFVEKTFYTYIHEGKKPFKCKNCNKHFVHERIHSSVKFVEKTFYIFTRKYPLRGYILALGAPGTPGVNP